MKSVTGDLTGKRFTRLLVLGPSEEKYKWDCLCDCGRRTTVRTSALVRKEGIGTKSCGCLKSVSNKGWGFYGVRQKKGDS